MQAEPLSCWPLHRRYGKCVVGGDVIHLRGGLVVPGAPRLAAVDGDDGALIAGDEDGVGVVGIDPDVLVIVAAGGAAEAGPRLAGVGGFPGDGAGDVDDVGIFGIDGGDGKIAAADASGGTRSVVACTQVFAGVIGAVGAVSAVGGDGGKEAAGVAGGDGEVGLDDAFGAGGNPSVSWCQVVPPSVDLKMPPPGPFHEPFSQGPSRASHSAA